MRRPVFVLLLVPAMVVAAPPAAFGRRGPKIPEQQVIKTYDTTISAAKLTIPPVHAGFAASGPVETPSPEELGINLATYTGSLAILQRYVGLIAGSGPRPDIVPSVSLKLGDRPEAFAESESKIVLTTGLVKLLVAEIEKSPEGVNQLLFILAHEYSHTLYDHPRLFAERSKDHGIAETLAGAQRVAVKLRRISAKLGAGTAASNQAIGVIQGAHSLSPLVELELYRFGYAPYQKDQEQQADFMAADLLRRMEQRDPRTGSTILLNFERYDDSLTGQLQAGLKHLNEEVGKALLKLQAEAPGMLLSKGPDAVLGSASGAIKHAIQKTILDTLKRHASKSQIHVYYSADFRVDGVQSYDKKFYLPIVVKATPAALAAWSKEQSPNNPTTLAATFTRENAPNEAAFTARDQLLAGDVAGARKTLETVKRGGKKSAFFYIVDAQTWQFAGDGVRAEQSYKNAVALPEAPLNAFFSLASAQDALGKSGDAITTLKSAGVRFGRQLVIVPMIQHYVALEQLEPAKQLVIECAAYPSVRDDCKDALPDPADKKKGFLGVI